MCTHSNLARACGLLAVSWLAACSIVLDTDRHRSGVVPIAATEFCAEFADIACTALRDCCPEPSLDLEGCVSTATAECATEFGALAIDPRTGYDAGQAGLALAEARELVVACDPGIETWSNAPGGFQRILAGTIPFGEPCDPNVLDVPNLFACADDGVCTQMGSAVEPDWRCAPPTPQDGECTFDAQCAPGLRCSAAFQVVTSGTCQPLKANGLACVRNSECATHLCDVTCRDATNDEAYCGL